MQHKIFGGALALALLSTSALAADLPSRRAPPVYIPPPIPVFTWTGFYIGGQVGYEFGRQTANARSTLTGGGLASVGTSPSGVIGGAHIGYNFSSQGLPLFGSALGTGGVIGIEGDVDGTSAKSSYAYNPFLSANYRENIMGSVRGRLGYAVDRALFYATGGVAFGGFKNNYYSLVATDSPSSTRVGYTVGGGVEYAFTNNWSVRVEYRYTDFGKYTDTLTATTAGGVGVTHRITDNRVQAGFSYKFDMPGAAPVVARY
jgi:outer membrane immunogenic protein